MGNIETYVQQNATDTLAERPLSEVDEFVLCYLVYYDFESIVPGTKQGGSIALTEAAALYKEKRGNSQKNVVAAFLQQIAAAPRFRAARLSGYDELFRQGRAQFAALRITFEEGTEYIAFRGVDNSLTGWQEAFRASYSPSPSQRLAAAYLDRHLCEEKSVRIGGHSKGGNMALYAACACMEERSKNISCVTLFDSPGLTPGLFQKARYQAVADRVRRFVPAYSLVGRLFTEEAPDRIIASNTEGVFQHEPLHWKVEGRDFAEADGFEEKGEREARILNRWIAGTTKSERMRFTEDLFRVLRERRERATTASRQTSGKQSRFEMLCFGLRSYVGASKDSRRAVRKLIRAVLADKWKGRKTQ